MSISNHDRIKAYSQLEIHWKQGFGKYSRLSRLISDILGKVYSDVLCSGVPIHFLQLLVWGIALIPVFRIIIFSKFDAHTSPLFSHLDDVIIIQTWIKKTASETTIILQLKISYHIGFYFLYCLTVSYSTLHNFVYILFVVYLHILTFHVIVPRLLTNQI